MSPPPDVRSWRRHRPDLGDGALRRRIVLAGGLGLLVWGVVALLPAVGGGMDREVPAAAFQRREDGVILVEAHRSRTGPPIDTEADPNRTGLVGPEVGGWTTSLGSLEAKRTAASPEMAALIAHLLRRAGVGPGDVVAIGASGSFPGRWAPRPGGRPRPPSTCSTSIAFSSRAVWPPAPRSW